MFSGIVRATTRRKMRYGLLSTAAILASVRIASADSFLWTGAGANPFWDLANTNWNNTTLSTTTVPWSNNVNRTNPNLATFSLATPPTSIAVNDNIDVGSLTFTTAGWNLAGGTGMLAYGATGTITISSGTGTDTIGAVIADGSTFGSGGGVTSLSKSGVGTVVLAGANTYTGTTTISAGTLQVGNGGATGNLSSAAVSDSGTLVYNLNSSFTSASPYVINNTISGAGAFMLASTNAAYVKLGSSATMPTGALTVNGGTLDLNGQSISVAGLSEATTAAITNAGAINGTATITVTAGAASALGVLTDGGNGGKLAVTINGGTLTLNAATYAYTGDTTLISGTLRVGNPVQFAGRVVLKGGTADGNSTGKLDSSTNVFFDANGGSFQLASASGTTFTVLGSVTVVSNTTIKYYGVSTNPSSDPLTLGGVLQGDGNGDNAKTLILASSVDQSGTVVARRVVLSGTAANTFGGTITLAQGQLLLNKTAGVDAIAGPLTVGNGTDLTINSNTQPLDRVILGASNQIKDTVTLTFNGSLNAADGGINVGVFDLAGFSETVAAITSATSGAGEIGNGGSVASTLIVSPASGTATYSGVMRDTVHSTTTNAGTLAPAIGTSTLAFSKSGAGTQILAGNNNYTGPTTVSAGMLSLGGTTGISAGTLSSSSAVTVLGGTFAVDNSASGATGIASRFGALTVYGGGTFAYIGNATTPSADSATSLTLVQTSAAAPAVAASNQGTMTFGSLIRSGRSTVVFIGPSLGGNAKLFFSSGTNATNGILPYALVDATTGGLGTGFAAYGANGVMAISVTNSTIAAGGNVVLTASDSGTGTVNSLVINGSGLAINGSGTVTVSTGGILNHGGSNTISASTLAFGALEAIIHAQTNLTISSSITGSGGLTKAAAGTLTLTSTSSSFSNSAAAPITIEGGTLAFSADANLGVAAAAGSSIILNGGTLSLLAGSGSVTLNANRGIALGPVVATTGNGTLNAAAGTTLTVNGIIANNGAAAQVFNMTGGGTIALSGSNTYNGITNVSGGSTVLINSSNSLGANVATNTLLLDNGSIISSGTVGFTRLTQIGPGGGTLISTSGTLTITGAISDAVANTGGGVTINNSGGGIVAFSGNNTFSGGLVIQGGQLNITSTQSYIGNTTLNAGGFISLANAGALNSANSAFVSNGGTFTNTVTRTASWTLPSTTLNPGATTIVMNANWTNSSNGLVLNGITRNPGGTINFGALPTTGGFISTTTANATFVNGQQTILGGYAVIKASANQWSWAVSGTGGAPGNITALTSFTTLTSGDISASSGKDLDLTSTATGNIYTSAAAATVNSLRFSGVNTPDMQLNLTLSNPLTIATGGILLSSASSLPSLAITGSTLTSGNGQDLILFNSSSANATNITIGSQITGAVGLTFTSLTNVTATLSLTSNANDFTGETNLNGNTLSIGANNALQKSTLNFRARASSATVPAPAIVFASGVNAPVFGGLKGDGNISLTQQGGGAALTLTVGGNNQNTTYSGVLSSGSVSSNLIKAGTGTLTLSGVNTYTGATTIQGGTLALTSTGSIAGSGKIIVGDTLADNAAVLNVSSVAGGLHVINGQTLGGYGTVQGAVTVNSGGTLAPSIAMPPGSTGTLAIGSLTTSANAVLLVNLATPNAAAGVGSDMVMVTGSNGMTLNGGTIQVNVGANTGTGSLGYYKILGYTGTLTLTQALSALSLPTDAAGVRYTLSTTQDSGYIDLHRGFIGDANDNGFVDLTDLTALASNWQQPATSWAQGDFNNDGFVDLTDLTALAGAWQTGIQSFGAAADSISGESESFHEAVSGLIVTGVNQIPEPASLYLLTLSASIWVLYRRKSL